MGTKMAQLANPLCGEFPVIMENGKSKAFVVDAKVFQRLQVILDNLLRREPETEDALIATSKAFQKLLAQVEVEKDKPSSSWREELRAL